MKLMAIAAATAVLALGTAAHAQQQQPAASPLYGELGYSWNHIKGFGATTDSGSVRGIVGYDLHPNLALEGMLAGGTSHDSDNGVSMKLQNSYGVFAKPKYAIGDLELFGRLGWAHTKVDASCATGCSDRSGNDLAYGLGVNYHVNPRMTVGLDYMRLMDKDGVKVDGVTLGVGYHF